MQTNSIHRARIDWSKLRHETYAAAAGAKSTAGTYLAIEHALWALRDNHSFFVPPSGSAWSATVAARAKPRVEGRRINNVLGYIRIPSFAGPRDDDFANQILQVIRQVDSDDVCGWIVDLRGNGGGNMWPMLRGVRPILGPEIPGYFVNPDGQRNPWIVDTSNAPTYRLKRPDPPVAVLHDEETASSGEAVAVAFRGRADTRSFGRRTRGLSTANQGYPLSDGATLVLTVATYQDRTGILYGREIEPDEVISGFLESKRVLNHATLWLLAHAKCSPGTDHPSR